jgi:hypothetical protein
MKIAPRAFRGFGQGLDPLCLIQEHLDPLPIGIVKIFFELGFGKWEQGDPLQIRGETRFREKSIAATRDRGTADHVASMVPVKGVNNLAENRRDLLFVLNPAMTGKTHNQGSGMR